jgi:hypothetical protein
MSDKVKRCHLCNGSKIIRGLGMMEKECTECFGIGWVSNESVDVKKSDENLSNNSLPKKRGRKPKAALNCGTQ